VVSSSAKKIRGVSYGFVPRIGIPTKGFLSLPATPFPRVP
jgi:hypothetical protein